MLQPKNLKTNKNSWQHDYRTALRSEADIKSFFNLKETLNLPFESFIPVSFAHKIKTSGEESILWKQFIPIKKELSSTGKLDPIGDLKHAKHSGIIHRYKNRILYTPTNKCPIICRYCFRKNELSSENSVFNANLNKLGVYLDENPQVEEVILTGGDPLILSNQKLDLILTFLADKKIKYVRFHTRTPVILPSRIDDGLIFLLNKFCKKFIRINFVLHTNHANELDSEVVAALNKLRDTKVTKLTQSVLLKGINDHPDSLIDLFKKIIETDFTPYYLHHPDKVRGAMHFYLDLEDGRRIYSKLHDSLPGWAIPKYVIDNDQGEGKQFAFNPESFAYSGKLLNKDGILSEY